MDVSYRDLRMRTAGKALIIFLGFSMAWGDAGASSTRAAVKVPRSARLCDESVNFVSAVHRPLRSPTMSISRDEAHIVMGRLRGGEGGEGERGGMVIGAVGKVVVHDADSTSITIAWDPADGAKRYEVQMRLEGGGEGDFTTLSDKLLSTIVRKRNLKPGTRYEFRIRGRAGEGEADTSGSMSETIAASTAPEGEMRLPAPKMMGRDEGSITVKWEEVAGAESYEVSMRVGGGGEKWEVIAPALKQAIVRKKNLVVSDGGYFFRIKPVGASGMSFGLSEASACMHAAFLPEYFTKLFGGGEGTGNLVNAKGEKLLVGSLAGKVVAAYCSASWCPPCKQFTPMLAQYYQRMKASGRPFEVVFVSCDKDQGSFSEYLSHMPWLAIPFASDARESALAALRVQGIPQLTVFAANGKKVEQNAVQKIMQASPDPMDAWERGESAP